SQLQGQGKSRVPVPEAAELFKADNTIRDLFKDEYASDKPANQLALSKKLLDQAQDATNDLVSRYVLFREARDLAAKARDLNQAWQAVDEMAKVFEVNVPAEKYPALESVAAGMNSPTSNESLVSAILPLADAALRLEDFGTAEQFLKIADTAA